jgi:hypothetical protein
MGKRPVSAVCRVAMTIGPAQCSMFLGPTMIAPPALNDALTGAVKINRPIHHRKAVLAGRIQEVCGSRISLAR